MEGHEVMMNDDRVVESVKQVLNELHRAEHLHPIWPSDPVRQVAILVEEVGEAVQVANDIVPGAHKLEMEMLRNELIQSGAMAIRCLINLEG